jgi:hypothetical protein
LAGDDVPVDSGDFVNLKIQFVGSFGCMRVCAFIWMSVCVCMYLKKKTLPMRVC